MATQRPPLEVHLKDLTWEWDKVAEAQTLVVLLLSLHSLQRISAVDITRIWPARTLGFSCLWRQLYSWMIQTCFSERWKATLMKNSSHLSKMHSTSGECLCLRPGVCSNKRRAGLQSHSSSSRTEKPAYSSLDHFLRCNLRSRRKEIPLYLFRLSGLTRTSLHLALPMIFATLESTKSSESRR